ncbi:MAG: hypothetical protein ACFFCS_03645 [Candidatus Hodarchaeota archaeon]
MSSFVLILETITVIYTYIIGGLIWFPIGGKAPLLPMLLLILVGIVLANMIAIHFYGAWGGKLLTIILLLLEGALILIYQFSELSMEVPYYFDVAVWGYLLIGLSLFLIIYNIILMSHDLGQINRRKKGIVPKQKGFLKNRPVYRPKASSKAKILLGLLTISSVTLATLAYFNWGDPYFEVTIVEEGNPGHAPVQFNSWMNIHYSFTPAQWSNMENYNFTAYSYSNSDIGNFVTRALFLKSNYPNIRLVPSVYDPMTGLPDIFNTDAVVAFGRSLLNACITNNLTNVVGFIFDNEGKISKPDNPYPGWSWDLVDYTINEYNKLIAEMRAYNPDYEITVTPGCYMLWDEFDGDHDFQYAYHHVVSAIDWDIIVSQHYRNQDGQEIDGEPPNERGDLVDKMLSEYKAFGPEKTGLYLGFLGFGSYHNLDELIIDCQLMHGIGVKHIGFFTMDSRDSQGIHYPGFFEAYGDTGLDQINDSLFGLDQPITIRVSGNVMFGGSFNNFMEDFGANVKWWVQITFSAGGFSLVVAMHIFYSRKSLSREDTMIKEDNRES